MAKIGFCCKWIDNVTGDPKARRAITERMNQKTTTQKHLASLSRPDQYKKIKQLIIHNCDALWRQLSWIADQPEGMRLFRITSEFLPLRTVKAYDWIYAHYEIEELITERLRSVRNFADHHNIRLCFHPGQFTNLCSVRADVVKASIEDFEYHASMARLMGYGDTWHSSGFAINIHANVRQDPGLKNIRRIINNDLTDTARNLITLENDEYSCGINDFIDNYMHEDVALVLDIHHHWIHSKGQHISHTDFRTYWVEESWRGMKPLGHFSMPSDAILPAGLNDPKIMPDYDALVAQQGISSSTLRAHSYSMWNNALLYWASKFLKYIDLEVEAKGKNVASREFYDYA